MVVKRLAGVSAVLLVCVDVSGRARAVWCQMAISSAGRLSLCGYCGLLILVHRFAFGFGLDVHVADQLFVALTLFYFSTCKHSLLGFDHDVGWQQGFLAEQSGVVHKAGHVRCRKPVQHAAHADDFTGENTGVDRGLGIVAHHAAKKLHSRRHFLVAVGDVDFAVCVLQVAVACSGSQVDPATQITVP